MTNTLNYSTKLALWLEVSGSIPGLGHSMVIIGSTEWYMLPGDEVGFVGCALCCIMQMYSQHGDECVSISPSVAMCHNSII